MAEETVARVHYTHVNLPGWVESMQFTSAPPCQRVPTPRIFVADDDTTMATAVEICNKVCPAREECLVWAMLYEEVMADGDWPIERFGVWGGMTPDQRTELWWSTRPSPDDCPSCYS